MSGELAQAVQQGMDAAAAQAGKPNLGAAQPSNAPVGLILSAKRETWRMDDEAHGSADSAFQLVRRTVLKANKHTCMGANCKFTSMKWQDVHHRDNNHANNSPDNLVTLCPLCHQVFHIGRAAMDGARLIWLPGVPQGIFNNLLRMLYFGAETVTDEGDWCRALIGALQERQSEVRNRIGLSDPAMLAEVFFKLDDADYKRRNQSLDGVLLMPAPRRIIGNKDVWPDMMAFWRSEHGPLGGYAPGVWRALHLQIVKMADRHGVNLAA